MTLKSIFLGGLLPWYSSGDEYLDKYGEPSSFTGMKPYKEKVTFYELKWLGLSYGVMTNLRAIDESDLEAWATEDVCPGCGKAVMAQNKLGERMCMNGCDYHDSLFEDYDE